MLKEVILAVQAYFAAHRVIQKNRSLHNLVFFALLYALFFIGVLYLYYITAQHLTTSLIQRTNIKQWLQSTNGLLTFFFAVSMVMINVLCLLYYFCLLQFLGLMLFSPLFTYGHNKISAIFFNDNSAQSITIKALSLRGALLAITNLGWLTLYFVVLILASLIPIIGWITPLIALFALSIFFGSCMFDYVLALRGFSKRESTILIDKHKGLCIGNGFLFYLLHIIPILGWVIAPIYSIIAAQYSFKAIQPNYSNE